MLCATACDTVFLDLTIQSTSITAKSSVEATLASFFPQLYGGIFINLFISKYYTVTLVLWSLNSVSTLKAHKAPRTHKSCGQLVAEPALKLVFLTQGMSHSMEAWGISCTVCDLMSRV